MHSNSGVEFSALTFILAGGQGKRLSPFTDGRAKPLVPFGGEFRIVDFTLSNCVNSGIGRAYLLTQYKASSIRSYIRDSSWATEFSCLPPRPGHSYHGTADAIYQNMDILLHEKSDYVLVLAADHIYKMDYRKLLRFHASHGGDATIAAVQYPKQLAGDLGVLEIGGNGQIDGFREKPGTHGLPPGDSSMVVASMGIYVFNATTLRKALLRDAGNFRGSHDFGKDILPHLISNERVFAYDFAHNDGPLGNYWRDVGSIDTYYRAHMELLLLNSTSDPYGDARWPVYAGGKNVSFCNRATDDSSVLDSIVVPGAECKGARIQQSVLSSSVHVLPGAQVQGSVLMQGVCVGRDAMVRHAIIEEGVVLPDGERIGCDAVEDRRRFHVTENGVVVVRAAAAGVRGTASHTMRRAQSLHL